MRIAILLSMILTFGLPGMTLQGQEPPTKPDETSKSSNFSDRSAYEELQAYKKLPFLRKYRRHFSSLTCWNIYGPTEFKNYPYGSNDPEKNPFGAAYLLISADADHRIFISDASTGEVFRVYYCPRVGGRYYWLPSKGKNILDEETPSLKESKQDDDDDTFYNGWADFNTDQAIHPITHIVMSPDLRLFAYVSDFAVSVHDTFSNTHVYYNGTPKGQEVLSLAFRRESLNGCDILEVVSRGDFSTIDGLGATYREYFAIPLETDSESPQIKGKLDEIRLNNLDGVYDDEGGFPIFGRNCHVTPWTYKSPEEEIRRPNYEQRANARAIEYMRQHSVEHMKDDPSKNEDLLKRDDESSSSE